MPKRLAKSKTPQSSAALEGSVALREAINYFSPQDASAPAHILAAQLGVSQQAVAKWEQRGWAPDNRASEIEALTGVKRLRMLKPELKRLIAAI